MNAAFFLADLPLDVYQQASPLFEEDIYEVLDPYIAVNRRTSAGGTGFIEVKKAIEKAKQMIEA